jgi:FAD/FMN-containing dehydrogenase
MATVAGTGLDAAAVEALRAAVRGALLRPGDADYDAARRVWNGMIDRRPALIARCAGAADVIKGVAFAREHGLLVAVRGGGHNVTGNAVCDDGLMLDLSPMKGIRVDPARLTVRAEAGVTWGELDRETQAFGLATTGGQVSTTGIAGLTLGGGIGWLMRKYGLAIDNLLSADVVTADGRLLTASADENPDLFWGIRGGGGNFGVVTSFEYRLHRVGPMITGGMALYPAARAAELLRFFRALTADAPEDLNVVLAFLTAPPAPFVPPELVGTPLVGFALGHLGTPEEGQAAIERIRAFGAPAIDLLGPMPYTALQSMTDGALPFGLRVYLKSSHLTGLDDALIDTVVRQMQAVTSPLSQVVIVPLGGAVARVADDATAFGRRDTPYDIVVFSVWTEPGEDERHMRWGRDFGEAVRPFARGVYVNEMGVEGEERVREAYTPATYQRLAALKRTYDPDNLFRLNQNIAPAG